MCFLSGRRPRGGTEVEVEAVVAAAAAAAGNGCCIPLLAAYGVWRGKRRMYEATNSEAFLKF